METYRLRVKIGDAEFEASGTEETVREQFESFKQLVESLPKATSANATKSPIVSSVAQVPAEDIETSQLKKLYLFGKAGDTLSLALQPVGNERLQRALLLVLYGFRKLLGHEDASVGAVKDSLEQSGFVVGRVDRIALPLTKAGLVGKGGKKGRGGKYRLTNLGIAQAELTAKEMIGLIHS